MKFEIDQQDAQAIMNYLITKPFIEVKDFVQILANLKKAGGKEPIDFAKVAKKVVDKKLTEKT